MRQLERGARCAVGCAAIWVASCGAHPPAPSAPRPAGSAPAPAAAARAPRQQLLAVLGGFASPDPIAVLPAPLRGALAERVAQLGPEDRAALVTAEWAARRPLFHLVAGGRERQALYLVAVGGGAGELIETSAAAGNTELRGVAAAITALTRAAAERWLFEARLDVASPSGATPELCDRIDQVAAALGDHGEVRLLARRVAVEVDPTPARRLDVAQALAWSLEAEQAAEVLAAVREDAAASPPNPALTRRLGQVEAAVATARTVEQTDPQRAGGPPRPPVAPEAALALARALLELDRPRDAQTVLGGFRDAARTHLGLATTLALADLGGTACPGMPPIELHLVVCAAAWREHPAIVPASALLESAWQSRAGRDDVAIETYLGLQHVMPWLYATVGHIDADAQRVLAESQARVAALRGALVEVAPDHPRFAGLSLFVDLLGAGFDAAREQRPSERVSVPEARRTALVAAARALAQDLPDEPHTQAAVLGVAAMLAQDRDGADLVALLPERVAARHREARWALDVWSAVAHGRPAAAERARTTLMELLAEDDPSVDRAQIVLTMAEADAALGGTAKDYANLAQVVERLGQQQLPRELMLRVLIDRAGVLQRQDRRAAAIEVLAAVADGEIPPGTSSEIDLAVLARAYLVYLRGLDSRGTERAEYAAKLRGYTAEVSTQVSVGVTLAHALWLRELDYFVARDSCERTGCSVAALDRQRPSPLTEVRKIVGEESALLVERGVLPLGSVTASFTYSRGEGLQPRVILSPILPAAPLPKTR